ncbi:MAG: HAD-IA family hydrolase [Oscillospiraceae bacterium]|nr:HAD-IA family hydrolase [Oscillospiraceae bacterium]
MKKPEMIIFDYGHTLLYQPGFNTSNGSKALYEYIAENPRNISFEEFDKTIIDIFAKIKAYRGGMIEIHEYAFLKIAMEYMDITLSVSFEEAEKIIMNGISQGGVMPYADIMLDYLNSKNIRTGVISNICFSGNALKDHIDRLLPNNKLEFVLASSDYIFKKPDPFMYEIALKKAELTADKVWYCGDSIYCDVNGAHNAGIFPVLYEGSTAEENPSACDNQDMSIPFEHLHIHDWRELIEALDKMG